MNPKFTVKLLEEVNQFLNEINEKAREKIIYNLRKSQMVNDPELFKKLNDKVWEFRTVHNKTNYRLFAFWDKSDKKETLVIATHGIEKKTAKTPKNEIEKTERIMKMYFETRTK